MDRNRIFRLPRSGTVRVALRKESVDRNVLSLPMYRLKFGSLSARRAWIEITGRTVEFQLYDCRSPQGERG